MHLALNWLDYRVVESRVRSWEPYLEEFEPTQILITVQGS